MSLAISPPPLEQREIADRELSYYVGGEGPPLVLVHGMGGAASNWLDLARLLRHSYRLIVPELPGHGGSGLARDAVGLTGFAASVRACAEQELGQERPVVIGHSLGGQIAVGLAAQRPSWPRAIVLAAASGISSRRAGRRRALAVSTLIRPARRVDALRPLILKRRLARRLALGGLVSDIDALSVEMCEAFLAGAAGARSTLPAFRALGERDPRYELGRVDVPALVLWGARDRALPLADAFDYTRRLGARLRVLADTGHLLIGERPELCARLIDEFVAELDA